MKEVCSCGKPAVALGYCANFFIALLVASIIALLIVGAVRLVIWMLNT